MHDYPLFKQSGHRGDLGQDRQSEQERLKWDQYYASLHPQEEDEGLRKFNAEFVDRVLELIPAGGKVLEAGCGGGWQSLALARTGKLKVSLMDFSREALQYARRSFEREGLVADFIDDDVFQPGKPEFDLVFNAGVLEHYALDQQIALLRGKASRSRKFVLTLVPNPSCYWYWVWRLQKSGEGSWPYGREVPTAYWSALFRDAGLRFLGQAYMGEAWTESLIRGLGGLDERLKTTLLEIHRSPVIPRAQKSYLVAALGSVSKNVKVTSRAWTIPLEPEAQGREAELSAALVDALALRIAAEGRLLQLGTRVVEKDQLVAERDQKLQMQADQIAQTLRQLADREEDLHAKTDRLAEGEHRITGLTRELQARSDDLAEKENQIAELNREFQAQTRQLGEKDHRVEELNRELDARAGELMGKEHEITELNQELQAQAHQLGEKDHRVEELNRELEARAAELKEREQQISGLTREMRAKGHQLAGMERQIGELDRRLQTQGEQLAERQHQLTTHQTSLITLQAELRQSRVESAQWRSELEKVQALRSYRMMEPLRRLYWHFRAVRARARRFREATGWVLWSKLRDLAQRMPPSPLKRRARQLLQWQNLRGNAGPWRVEFQRILAAHGDVRGVIIYPPTLDWNFMFQRPQQLSRAFARAGYLFFFCTQNTRVDKVHGFQPVEKNLLVCHVPWQTFADLQEPILLVSWAVHRPLLDAFRRCTLIYDCLDDLEVGGSRPEDHEALLQRADVVLATSRVLLERIQPRRPDVQFCPNAADYDFFCQAQRPGPLPPDLEPVLNNGRPVVGYHGALAKWFDYELLDRVAEEKDDCSFVLLGVDYDGTLRRSGLLKRPNVSWLGLKPYRELPDYLRWFTVGTIPFLINQITEATSPIKVWEYLSAAKPVVSTDLPMCRGLDGVSIARDVTEFCEKIDGALQAANDPVLGTRMDRVARANTWEARASQILAALELRRGGLKRRTARVAHQGSERTLEAPEGRER